MDRWLKRSVLSEFSRVPGRSGLYYKNLATGEEFGVRQDEAFLAASVIKLPVFAAVASLAEQGEARWDEKLKARREERVPPCGALWFFRDEPEVRLDTLCELMITLSDNMATNLILRRFGLEMLNECFRALGLRTTHLERVLFDAQAAAQGRENVFSPREMGALLEGVVGQDICQNWTTYLSKVSVLLESQNCTISFKKRPSLPRLQRGPLGYEVIPFLCPNQPCSAKRQSHQSAYPGQHYYTLRPRHAIAP